MNQHNQRNSTGTGRSSWGTGTRDKNPLGLQNLVNKTQHLIFSKSKPFYLYGQLVFAMLKNSGSLRATCNLLPLDRNVCLASSLRRWPSFCQAMLGAGLPLATQSSAAALCTSTVTSSGRSPSAPPMDGGTANQQNGTRILWLGVSQSLVYFILMFLNVFLDRFDYLFNLPSNLLDNFFIRK